MNTDSSDGDRTPGEREPEPEISKCTIDDPETIKALDKCRARIAALQGREPEEVTDQHVIETVLTAFTSEASLADMLPHGATRTGGDEQPPTIN